MAVAFQAKCLVDEGARRRGHIPIINVFRIRDGKIVEVWNHRHDIDTGQANFIFVKGLVVGLLPAIALLVVDFMLWRKLRKARAPSPPSESTGSA